MKMTRNTFSPRGKFLHIISQTTLPLVSLMYDEYTMVAAFISIGQFTLDQPISDFDKIAVIVEMVSGDHNYVSMIEVLLFSTDAQNVPLFQLAILYLV